MNNIKELNVEKKYLETYNIILDIISSSLEDENLIIGDKLVFVYNLISGLKKHLNLFSFTNINNYMLLEIKLANIQNYCNAYIGELEKNNLTISQKKFYKKYICDLICSLDYSVSKYIYTISI